MSELKELIIDELRRQSSVFYTSINKVQNYVRCPFCGDSLNESHGHLSIKIDVMSDAPMVYRCLKCNISGLVTDTFLEELGVFLDSDSKRELKSFTKKSMRVARLVNLDVEKYITPLSQDSSLCERKLQYVRDRLGIDLDLAKARDYKIILDFFDFIKVNDLIESDEDHLVGLNYKGIYNLNENYVGFLSTNNNNIIFRDITGKQKYRYFKVILNGRNVNMDSFYSIPSKLPLMYTVEIDVHVAEGVFDILSIKDNLIRDTEKNYFYATCGFGSVNIIKYLIHHGLNTGVRFHIYSDNDKSDWDHRKYLFNKNYLTEWIDRIYLHRNRFANEKDYGVPISRIHDTQRTIK